jgi:hypothetical protein
LITHHDIQTLPVCDNCTQTLLDTVDEMMYQFEVNAPYISIKDLKAPWIKLYELSNETEYLNDKFDEYFDAADAVDNFGDVATDEVCFRYLLVMPVDTDVDGIFHCF